MSPETGPIKIEPIDTVPERANLCHYDELNEEIKDLFPELVSKSSSTRIGPATGDVFDTCDCEVVKFTNYYRIIRDEC